jgi:DNA-binding MarR family transcriptional regulator
MEGRGLIEREECVDDGRGSFVVLTPTGRKAIERAAPEHVRTVRELVFDSLTDDEVDILGQITTNILNRVQRQPSPRG